MGVKAAIPPHWTKQCTDTVRARDRSDSETHCVHPQMHILPLISFNVNFALLPPPSGTHSLFFFAECCRSKKNSFANIFKRDYSDGLFLSLNGMRPRTISARGVRYLLFFWVNVPDLRSFFLCGKPWWQFESGAAENPEERWVPPINHTSSRFSNGYRRTSNTPFRWRLSVVIFAEPTRPSSDDDDHSLGGFWGGV